MFLGLDVGMDAQAATAEHLEVLKAIAARDSARARALTSEQLLRTEKRILTSLANWGLNGTRKA
jgi:DNA-binding GntR family transcriptional regulator